MITVDEFKAVFKDVPLVTFDVPDPVRQLISNEDSHWLASVGLPDSAAPFLGFGHGGKRAMQEVSEISTLLPAAMHGRYRTIGSNGSGDPVVLDMQRFGAIYYLNHDDLFRPILINSAVRQLACCLAMFRQFTSETIRVNGRQAFLDRDFPSGSIKSLEGAIRAIDPNSMNLGTFWHDEIEQCKES
jgi:hypothetical protein